MSKLKYVGCDLYDNLKVRVIYEKELSEKFGDMKVMHQFVYPYISGWYRGKWTHNPNDISKFPKQVQDSVKKLGQIVLKKIIKVEESVEETWVE